MTDQEYDNLSSGDVIENKTTGAKYVILNAAYPPEPLVQITKDRIFGIYDNYKIVLKAVKDVKPGSFE